MGRKAEYNKDDVLDRATLQFRRDGYRSTRVDELVKITGLNKHSLYKTFDGKDGLFKQALEHYRDFMFQKTAHIFVEPNGLQSIREFLKFCVHKIYDPELSGCLMKKSMIEKQYMTQEHNEIIDGFFQTMQDKLVFLIKDAQNRNEIPAHKDPEILALRILCVATGMSSMRHTLGTPEVYTKMVNSFIDDLAAE